MPSLLTVASLVCLLGAGALAGRWALRRRDTLGRPLPAPVWSIALLVVLALVLAVPGARRRVEEARLASVAARLAGHRVTVHCQTNAAALVDAGAELGFVPYDENGVPRPVTTLKRGPCQDLRSYLGGATAHPTSDEVVAVHVLTHEAMHLRGETDEAVAECEAVQRDALTARMLGASARQARELAVRYWLTVYPDMPDDYRSRDCVPGGVLDEHLDSAPWAPVS